MNNAPVYFGLTGGIASGKSTVARMLEDLGARIIDADGLGHEFLHSGEPTHQEQEIVRNFGTAILGADGEIDRRRLGSIVFADPAKLQELNAIVHPRIIARTEELAAQCRAEDPHAVVVIDAALIFEAGIGGRFRKVIVAWCRPEQQIERLMTKAGLLRDEAQRRIAAQMPVDEKKRRADYAIDCSGSIENTRNQVAALWPDIQQLARTER